MRSIWTGAIGFGLVTIPVKLYSATQDSNIDLDMLDKNNQAHIKYKRVNEETGKEVQWGDIVKGYNYEGKYVLLDDKDFENASPEKSKYVDIFQFVKEEEIDSIYFETPYFLEPDKNGERPYALLREALAKAKMAGVGSFVLRNKEHLAIIRPYNEALLLNMIRFQEEIRDYSELKLPKEKTPKPAELKMAMELINQMSEPFDISKYKDTYNDKLMDVIKAKAKGVKQKETKMKVVHKETNDIMAQLKASLETRKKKVG